MLTRNVLLFLARQEKLKRIATGFAPFKRLTTRFVAGESLAEAVAAIKTINDRGCLASFDHLNESVANSAEAELEVQEYLSVLESISTTGIKSNVSIKLSQFGLEIEPELAYENARKVVSAAHRLGNFVRVDMEGSTATVKTLDIFLRLLAEFGRDTVGIVLQAYLRRTQADLTKVLEHKARVRICKGAYNEGADVAFPDKREVDENYIAITKRLLDSDIYHGIATHDPRMIDATIAYAHEKAITPESFEFQMLYGIRRDLQEKLAAEGYNVRVYVPYGKHWYPYFMRRLAERPANIWFVAKNLMKG
jgi:proline dehydrogenase